MQKQAKSHNVIMHNMIQQKSLNIVGNHGAGNCRMKCGFPTCLYYAVECVLNNKIWESGLNGWWWGLFLVECAEFGFPFMIWWRPIRMQLWHFFFGNVDQKSVVIESICMNKVQGMWRESGSWSGSNTGPPFWSDLGVVVAMDTLVYRRVLLTSASQDELPPIHSERNRNNDAFKLPKRGNVGHHQITTAVFFFH